MSADFNAARSFVAYELPKRLADRVRWREATQTPFADEYEAVPMVANFFETMGLFVKHRIIDERIACDAWSGVVLGSWQKYQTRSARVSTYPSRVKRMPEDRTLLEREAASP